MFQITKFVIAAALTAIIAAPIMAQAAECPCWTENDLEEVGRSNIEVCAAPYYVLVTRNMVELVESAYPAMLRGHDNVGNVERAHVEIDDNEQAMCNYGDLNVNNLPLDHDEFFTCIYSIKRECARRGF